MVNLLRALNVFNRTGERIVQDESLEEHDKKYHGGHFDPKTQTCGKRDAMGKGDEADQGFGSGIRMVDGRPLEVHDINGNHQVLRMSDVVSGKSLEDLKSFMSKNKDTYVRLYHGTGQNVTIEVEGIRRTNRKNRRTVQSSTGFVYLTSRPEIARRYGEFGYDGKANVYSVDVKVRDLKPDADSLKLARLDGTDIAGNGLAESLYYANTARVNRDILPYELSKMKSLPGIRD